MDQIKIGKFISEMRKRKNITQLQLSIKLGVTDRAISKWENGICMPDSGTIPFLCDILDITINDLFCGEIVDMKKNEKLLEENLLCALKEKEDVDRRLLKLEYVIGYICSIVFFVLIFVASYIKMSLFISIILIVFGLIIFLIGMFYCLRIEQLSGYYECNKCHNKYIPKYISVLFAMHFGRTRFLKCPKCSKWSFNKKVISK